MERVVGHQPAVSHPVFVLTHHPRVPLELEGGTYLIAGLVDELVLHLVPTLLGSGERLFEGVADLKGLKPVQTSPRPMSPTSSSRGAEDRRSLGEEPLQDAGPSGLQLGNPPTLISPR